MNIGLDARSIFSRQPRGTGRNLFDAYRLIPALRPEWRFTLYHQRDARECPLVYPTVEPSGGADQSETGWAPNVRTRLVDIPGDRFEAWFHIRQPTAAWRDGIELMHFPANAAPAWCPVPFVATIHDLIPLKVAGELEPDDRRRFYRGVARAVRGAVHLIAPSRTTRDDLCAEFGIPADSITVIPWAPDRVFLNRDHATERPGSGHRDQTHIRDDLRRRYGLTRPWLLNFSGSTHRKNAAGLIEGLARLPKEVRDRHQLVLIGCDTPAFRAALGARAQSLGVASAWRILGFVPHEDLPDLLAGARAMLMPSLYEGFGLPILDAFACGVPVLTSRRSSMSEVAGDAAVYCDPTSPQSIADGIAQVLRDDVAERLVRKGHQRVRDYTWERTAEAMCAVYERCIAGTTRCSPDWEVARCR